MAEQAIQGMTVHERLYHFGLMGEFEEAARARSVEALIGVLIQARFSEQQARYTATTLLENPARYGY